VGGAKRNPSSSAAGMMGFASLHPSYGTRCARPEIAPSAPFSSCGTVGFLDERKAACSLKRRALRLPETSKAEAIKRALCDLQQLVADTVPALRSTYKLVDPAVPKAMIPVSAPPSNAP